MKQILPTRSIVIALAMLNCAKFLSGSGLGLGVAISEVHSQGQRQGYLLTVLHGYQVYYLSQNVLTGGGQRWL
jgi:hypothetical protein